MSYINGIESRQQFAAGTAESTSTSRAAKTDSDALNALSGPLQDGTPCAAALDETRLSAASGVVSQALQGSDVRDDKVAALQQSIAAGTYSVPASDVAAKLISTLLE